MSAATHTPGPWRVVTRNSGRVFNEISVRPKQSIGFGLSTTSPVCRVVWYGDVGIANARLIAAAPDMLKSLQDLADAAQARENPMGDPCALLAAQANLRDATKRARSTIAKATGSEP